MIIVGRLALAGMLVLAACGGEHPPAGAAASGSASGASASASPDEERAAVAAAPSRRPLRDPVQLTVSAEVDGSRSTYSGLGECNHTEDASIYEVPASMWRASADAGSGDLRYLNLTLWQPKGSADMQVSLALTVSSGTHEIATVKGANAKGSGRGRVEPSGKGGTLTVEGKAADGRGVRVVVECTRWTEPVAEGG